MRRSFFQGLSLLSAVGLLSLVALGAHAQESRRLTLTLDERLVSFEADGSLKPESRLFLGRVGKFLARNSKAWGRIEVVGHIQGPHAGKESRHRAALRAQAADEALVEGGSPEFRLKSRGKIGLNPREDGWIELRMSGVTDIEAIQDGFEKVKKASR